MPQTPAPIALADFRNPKVMDIDPAAPGTELVFEATNDGRSVVQYLRRLPEIQDDLVQLLKKEEVCWQPLPLAPDKLARYSEV